MGKLSVLGLVLVVLTGSAFAAFDPSYAYNDGSKVWYGTTAISDEWGILSASVEWIVYPAGVFDTLGYNGYTPTLGEFVYAYQMTNVGLAPITVLAVEMLDSNEADNIGEFNLGGVAGAPVPGWGGTAPNLETAEWYWTDVPGNLAVGQSSQGLAYCSINAPIEYDFLVHDGGSSAENIVANGDPGVASPGDVIPEPGTLALLALGGLCALGRKRK